MSTAPIEPPALLHAAAARRVAGGRLATVAVAHAGVDFFSALLIPLLSVLEGTLRLTPGQGAVLLGAGSLASGLVQPLAAWWSDRHDTRLPGVLGAALAAAAVGAVGFARTYEQVMVLQILGTAGIGAFHPVAAAAMGQLSGSRRSLGITAFFTAGMVGGIAGSLFAPAHVRAFGLGALWWTIPPGLALAWWLMRAIRRVPHRTHDAHENHRSLSARERRWRWAAVGLLYAGNVLRFTVNMALVLLVVRYAEARAMAAAGAGALDEGLRTRASLMAGPLQAALQIGMGVGGLALGSFVRPRWEKAALVLAPSAGALAVLAMPLVPWPLGFVSAVACGAGFAGVIPLTVAMAQRLLPHRTSLASSLMMGGAWAFAAAGPWLAQVLIDGVGLRGAFAASAGMLLAAGLISLALPGWLVVKSAEH